MKNRKRPLALSTLALAFGTALVIANCITTPTKSSVDMLIGGIVRGYIATSVQVDPERTDISPSTRHGDVFLPAVRVHLRNEVTGKETRTVTTDLSGRFTFPAQPKGRYRVCWEARGFPSACSKTIITIGDTPEHIGTVRIPVESRKDLTAIFGSVRMGDGSSPRMLAPLANINSFARVQLLDGTGTLVQEVPVNNFGRYFLPRVPVRKSIVLRAVVEASSSEKAIHPKAKLGGANFHQIDLSFENNPPRVDPIIARDAAGERVKVAAPGSELKLLAQARDKDSDPLTVKWMASPGSGTVSGSGTNATWNLPDTEGFYSVTLFAYDRKGGYAQTKLSMRADNRGIPFSGNVEDNFGNPVGSANVEINGQLTMTSASGSFSARVKNADRFVLNIRKTNYALLSQIYDDSVAGGRWVMTQASVTTVDPTQPIDIREQRDPRNCPGPRSYSLDYKNFPSLATPQWQDGRSNVVAPFAELEVPLPGKGNRDQKRDCGPGVRLRIPAGGLEDKNGNLPAGNVDIALSTIDLLSRFQMPGDFTVLNGDRSTGVMQSYGAVNVEITAGGIEYNLKPGVSAEIEIPVAPEQLVAGGPIPPTIPILFYAEDSGVWVNDGEAQLVGNAYILKLAHFSAINTDLVKTDQACVRIYSPSLPANYELEIYIPQAGGAAPVYRSVIIDNSSPSEHVVYNLPANTNIVLVPIRLDSEVPIGTFVVNTGGSQSPTSPNLPAGPPYNACSTEVTLTDLAIPGAPISGEFLHGLSSFAATNIDELDALDPDDNDLITELDNATDAYYAQIDPRGKRTTLADFKTENGFDGPGEIRVIFANSGDLGFGRRMFGVKSGDDVAAYVTNYGDINTDDNADVINAVLDNNPIATVAMEYSRIESQLGEPVEFDDPQRVTKFYVYNADGSALLNAADLDDFGARPIPQLCMVCHGGELTNPDVLLDPLDPNSNVAPFTSRDDVKLGSRFLPFDLSLYTFLPSPTPFDKPTQQQNFKDFNEDLVAFAPLDPGSAIDEVIDEMYGVGATQIEGFVVPGWNGGALREQFYADVISPACRTCHISNVFPPLRFKDASDVIDRLGSVESRVCVQHVMPHAKVTHDLYWSSGGPHMPALTQLFGDDNGNALNGWNGTLCGQFTPGGDTPAGFYETNIQPIWDKVSGLTTACTGCHTGASPPGGLNLSVAGSYAALMLDSSQVPSMKRVAPGDHSNSYVWRKIDGSHAAVGGSGSRMPQNGPPFLSATDINIIRDWIDAGAIE